jgi:uncharacterized protein
MSTGLPDVIDAWRAVAGQRQFRGELPIAAMPRLAECLAGDQGSVRYALEFGRDALGVAFVALEAEGALRLICQRSLEAFDWTVALSVRLGLIGKEHEESALPPGYEPLLTATGELHPVEIIEDELILALPTVPLKPGSEGEEERSWTALAPGADEDEAGEAEAKKPFAALAKLKKQ